MSSHLGRGLLILGERWWLSPWIAESKTTLSLWIRRGMKALFWIAVFKLICTSWWLLAGAVLVVVVKALRAATKAAKGVAPKAPGNPAEKAEVAPTGRLPEVPRDVFLDLLRDVLGVAKGVHLRTLAAALTARVGGAWEIADVRRLCEAAGVAVTPTVRAPGGKPTVGVYRADLPPLPDPSPTTPQAPVAGVVVAGQIGTTPPTTPTTTGPSTTPATPTATDHGGLRIVAHDDPGNPARTHVTVIDSARRKRA